MLFSKKHCNECSQKFRQRVIQKVIKNIKENKNIEVTENQLFTDDVHHKTLLSTIGYDQKYINNKNDSLYIVLEDLKKEVNRKRNKYLQAMERIEEIKQKGIKKNGRAKSV